MVEHLLSHDNYATESYLPCKKMMFWGSCESDGFILLPNAQLCKKKKTDLSSLPARLRSDISGQVTSQISTNPLHQEIS